MDWPRSRAFKVLKSAATTYADTITQFLEMKGVAPTHKAYAYVLGGFIGFAMEQATVWGDLKDRERDELLTVYEVSATMTPVHAAAGGKMVSFERFREIAAEMQACVLTFGYNAEPALGTFIHRYEKDFGVPRELVGAMLINFVKQTKTRWPGGPVFERPEK